MLKSFLVLSLFSMLVLPMVYHTHNSLPDNDLWKEDYIDKSNTGQEMFNKVIDAAEVVYTPISKEFGDSKLTINRKWDDSTVNANATRLFKKVTINMYGGLFRRPETTTEGFALVLCHELSHAYGGIPYVSSWQKLSSEGQADYAGAKECLYKVLNVLNLKEYEEGPSIFIEDTCKVRFKDEARKRLCIRSLIGGNSLGNLLAKIKNESVPDYETPDSIIVEETTKSYPKTVQCRLDTYLNGTIQLKRPACWFKN